MMLESGQFDLIHGLAALFHLIFIITASELPPF